MTRLAPVKPSRSSAKIYWRPVYAFIRRNGYNSADAQDLTQEFFSRLISKDYLRHLRDQRGRFRSFLLTFVKHFLSDERDQGLGPKARRRTVRCFRWTTPPEKICTSAETANHFSPDQLFERSWAQTVLDRALHRLVKSTPLAEKAFCSKN